MIRIAVLSLAGSLLVSTAIAQAPGTGSTPVARPPTTVTSPTAPMTKPPATSVATNQFTDESAAKSHCPADTVVWVNLSSKVYHLVGTPHYGKTKKGAYICEKDADASGFRVAKGEVAKTKP